MSKGLVNNYSYLYISLSPTSLWFTSREEHLQKSTKQLELGRHSSANSKDIRYVDLNQCSRECTFSFSLHEFLSLGKRAHLIDGHTTHMT